MDIDTFGFFKREKVFGRTVSNRCGRDFLYYALSYHFPEEFSNDKLNPVEIEKRELFGRRLPDYLIWTGLTFAKVPNFLAQYGLILSINRKRIISYGSFLKALVFSSFSGYDEAADLIKKSVDSGLVAGVDIPIRLGGLVDHVMFVYGYDEESFYVFDTHVAQGVNYSKITSPENDRFIMKLPMSEVRKKWNRFSRVWEINRL